MPAADPRRSGGGQTAMSDSPLIFANPAPSRVRFSVGSALQATLDALGANLGPMVVLALIIVGVPSLLVHLINAYTPYGAVAPVDTLGRFLTPAALTLTVVNFLTGVLLQAAIARVVVTYLNRGRPRVIDSLSSTARALLPLLGIALLSALSLVAAFITFLIPVFVADVRGHLRAELGSVLGAYLILIVLLAPVAFFWVLWSVAAPAQVVEGRGVIGSLGRSINLTRNHRWAILGVMTILTVIGAVVSMIGIGLQVAVNMLLNTDTVYGGSMAAAAAGLASAVITSISGVFGAAARAAIYSVLRQAKEGVAPQSLASVFD